MYSIDSGYNLSALYQLWIDDEMKKEDHQKHIKEEQPKRMSQV